MTLEIGIIIGIIFGVVLYPVLAWAAYMLILGAGWLWLALCDALNWFKVLFFRARSLGGDCLLTVIVGMGITVPDMLRKKFDSEKSEEE